MVAISACVAPAVMVISVSTSWPYPYSARFLLEMAARSAGTPAINAYWLWPSRMAAVSRLCSLGSQLKSGKP